MAYYKKLNINGTEFLLAVNLDGWGAPTASTAASVGMFYLDRDDGSVYKCVNAFNDIYTWEPLISSEQIATAVENYLVENPIEQGEDGGYYTPAISPNGYLIFTPSKEGMPAVGNGGDVGKVKGEDGFSPTVNVKEIEGGHQIVITDKNSPKAFNVMDGASVTVSSVNESDADGGSNIVIFSDGKSLIVKNGKKYTLTETDKAEIVEAVLAALNT